MISGECPERGSDWEVVITTIEMKNAKEFFC
jgi:hypothetical protein